MKALTYVEMTGSFRQDIAVIHNTRRTNDFFMANNAILLHHPACSPNPNPHGKFWGWMAREVSEMDINSKHEAIFTTWNNIPASLLQTVILTIPKRIFEVIHNDSLATHYQDALLGVSYSVVYDFF